MSQPMVLLGAALVGLIVGWILATEINNLAWKRLAAFQKNTVKAQRDVIEVRKGLIEREERVTGWVEDLKKKDAEIEQEYKKAIEANQDALQSMKEANEMRDKTTEQWKEAVAAREAAVAYKDQTIEVLEKSNAASKAAHQMNWDKQ